MALRRITCYRYEVLARGKHLQERKVPFAGAGLFSHNYLADFIEEIKTFAAVRGCDGIFQLQGLVFADTEKYLKGYLTEPPPTRILRRPKWSLGRAPHLL